jgi:hypothetical protein
MGLSTSVPVSALDWKSLEEEAGRLLESFASLLAEARWDDERQKRYYAIIYQWKYIEKCLLGHPYLLNPDNMKWLAETTYKMLEMTSRFQAIRRLGLEPIDELDERLLD